MLEHLNAVPTKPARVVVIGAGGFVGGTIDALLRSHGVPTLPLTRRELDLLQSGAAGKLASMLLPTDSVVMVSAIAPAKNVAMLKQNLDMAAEVCGALSNAPIHHLLYTSVPMRFTRTTRIRSPRSRTARLRHFTA